MKVWGAAVFCIALTAPAAHAAEQTVPSKVAAAEAARLCSSGESHPAYGHPTDACWTAYEHAMAEGDATGALTAIRTGCEKYRRADQCFVLRQVARRTHGVVRVRQESTLPTVDELERATRQLGTWDIDDAESGVLRRPVKRVEARSVRAAGDAIARHGSLAAATRPAAKSAHEASAAASGEGDGYASRVSAMASVLQALEAERQKELAQRR